MLEEEEGKTAPPAVIPGSANCMLLTEQTCLWKQIGIRTPRVDFLLPQVIYLCVSTGRNSRSRRARWRPQATAIGIRDVYPWSVNPRLASSPRRAAASTSITPIPQPPPRRRLPVADGHRRPPVSRSGAVAHFIVRSA